jgi:hypothetical protein
MWTIAGMHKHEPYVCVYASYHSILVWQYTGNVALRKECHCCNQAVKYFHNSWHASAGEPSAKNRGMAKASAAGIQDVYICAHCCLA